ncbi:hypothetical protein LPB90_18785 [Chryseobacterium sp. LC2016-29]|uniref:hypothetical protein n=1 Tax=Chryseobacterium sp. LC2016-29 TaxID=2897331 RepID=UPI001E31BB4B|nr:hypothetical protein [Chryseobacterium sp. LC2016-29]MCD0480491.1 hypothetical protein [Chryseobacterium sp. LC2016-29]
MITTILTNNISFGIWETFSTIFIILFILSLCIYLYRISKYKKNKNLKYALTSLSILLFLHLIFFPFIYTLMLKNNPNSFEFKTSIHDNEKEITLNEWANDSKTLPSKITNLEYIKLSNSTILNKKLKELSQLTFTENHIIHSDINFNIPGRDFMATIYIFNKEGILKDKLHKSGGQTELDSTKFGSVINQQINYLKNELQYYKIRKKQLDRNNFWTYPKLLPYSISSIFTGNMSPITPMLIYFIQFIIL